MFDSSCIFCRIIQKQIPSEIITETEHLLVIKDINPKAPIHYLIIPKTHIQSLATLQAADVFYGQHLFQMTAQLAQECPGKAFNLISNNGASAGQSVAHLHFHFLAGRNLYEHGLKL